MPKTIKIVTGILSLLYFLSPYLIDALDIKSNSFLFYAFSFIPEWVYTVLSNLTPLKHFIPFIGLVLAALIFWICLYRLCIAVYDVYLDIYLNRKRFKHDKDADI